MHFVWPYLAPKASYAWMVRNTAYRMGKSCLYVLISVIDEGVDSESPIGGS
jgi:hypothetical protein